MSFKDEEIEPQRQRWLTQLWTIKEKQKQTLGIKSPCSPSFTFLIIKLEYSSAKFLLKEKPQEEVMECRVRTKRPQVSRLNLQLLSCSHLLFLERVPLTAICERYFIISGVKKYLNPPQVTHFRFLEPLPLLFFSHPTSLSVKIPTSNKLKCHFCHESFLEPFPHSPPPNINYLSSYEYSGHISNLSHDTYDTLSCIIIMY